jgi:hypothetical protein
MKEYIFIGVIVLALALATLFVEASNLKTIQFDDVTLEYRLDKASRNNDTIVVLVAGSGATDYNGNSVGAKGKSDVLLQLSKSLNDYGYDTFRFNKRNVKPENIIGNPSFDVFIDDLENVIIWLKEQNYSKIYLAGHSQGSLVAALAAQREQVEGVISLAGTARPINQILLEQLHRIGYYDEAKKVIDSLLTNDLYTEEIGIPENIVSFSDVNQIFMMTWMKHNPYKVYKSLNNTKLLFMQGTKDIQVSIEELYLFDGLGKLVELKGSNHVLKVISKESDNLQSYTDPSFLLDPNVAKEIDTFIRN